MVSQVRLTAESYCLLSEKPDNAKTTVELEKEIIQIFKEGIELVRASYGSADGEKP